MRKNLEQLVLLIMNWPNDPGMRIEMSNSSLEEFTDMEANSLAQLEDEIEDFVETTFPTTMTVCERC